jgi:hypothetical protein
LNKKASSILHLFIFFLAWQDYESLRPQFHGSKGSLELNVGTTYPTDYFKRLDDMQDSIELSRFVSLCSKALEEDSGKPIHYPYSPDC